MNRHTLLWDYLTRTMQEQYTLRDSEMESLCDAPAIRKRQVMLRSAYAQMLGELPQEKTPLEPACTGTIPCRGYQIEKIVFQSRPHHHVTANFYRPEGTGPFPGVLMLCGHAASGKSAEAYQRACILLAQNGIAALIVDPISQGERFQFVDNAGRPITRGGTTTHTLLDIGAKLCGTNVVSHILWDNIRSLDYLVSRPEVDPKRIGCTGNSGGGTQTTFLLALDPRIQAAAPSCYITTQQLKYLREQAADGCQELADEGSLGMDHGDYLCLFAPKPLVILAAEKDFFDINGTSKTYRELKRIYKELGHLERLEFFASSETHGFHKPQREVMVQWMRRWLLDDNGPVFESDTGVQTDADLQVTDSGQVMSDWNDEKSAADLHREQADRLQSLRDHFSRLTPAGQRQQMQRLVRCLRPGNTTVERAGLVTLPCGRAERLVMHGLAIPLPMLLFQPEFASRNHPALLVDSEGKQAETGASGTAAELLQAGIPVLSVDLRGYGETADDPTKNAAKYWNREHRTAVLAMHIGQPLLGQRVTDLLAALDFLLAETQADAAAVYGFRQAGPTALHAACLDNRIQTLVLRESPHSWLDVVDKPLLDNQIGLVIPEVLRYYDLPQLCSLLGDRSCTWE